MIAAKASSGIRWISALAPLTLLLAGCATAPGQAGHYPEQRAYLVTPDPGSEVDAALARAQARGTRVLLVMGANWCHDSRALAGWLATDRFQTLVAQHYELVFVDIGTPQDGAGRNLDIAARFGLTGITGTPNLLVVSADGVLLNADTARAWRNAASRSESAIYAELAELATRPG